MAIFSPATVRSDWAVLEPLGVSARFVGVVAGTLRRLAAQQMPARDEQIGQRAGHEQTMSVLLQPAIAHLGKAKHSRLMIPIGCSTLARTFGPVFRPLDLVHDTAMAIAAVDEVLRSRCKWHVMGYRPVLWR